MILFLPNVGLPVHLGHLLTYVCGWFSARSRDEILAVLPDLTGYNAKNHLADCTLDDLELLWSHTIADFEATGLVADHYYSIPITLNYVTEGDTSSEQVHECVFQTGAQTMVRGTDLLTVKELTEETIFSPIIETELGFKLSSTCQGPFFDVRWALNVFGSSLDLVKALWEVLQRPRKAPASLSEMVYAFDVDKICLEPVNIGNVSPVCHERIRTFKTHIVQGQIKRMKAVLKGARDGNVGCGADVQQVEAIGRNIVQCLGVDKTHQRCDHYSGWKHR